MNPSIPETLLNDLRSITTTLETNLGDILQSVVLYGGLTKNELVKDTDRVTLMRVGVRSEQRLVHQGSEAHGPEPSGHPIQEIATTLLPHEIGCFVQIMVHGLLTASSRFMMVDATIAMAAR